MALVVLQSPGRVFNLETQSMKTRFFIRPSSDSRVALVSSKHLFGNLLDVTLVFDDREFNHVALVVLQTPLAIIQPEDPMCEKCFLENVQKLLLTFWYADDSPCLGEISQ